MATTIDGTWIAAHGTGGEPPFLLDTDNEVYTLAADVRLTGTYGGGQLFLLTGKNVFLNLNGYKIYYNGWVMDQDTSSEKASAHETRAISTNQIKNTTGGKYTLGRDDQMKDINVDPTDIEKLTNY